MVDDTGVLPMWAVELTRQVAILNEKIPTHIDWVERNVKDHETRLRDVETGKASTVALNAAVDRIDKLESKSDQSAWAGRIGWLGIGAAVAGVTTFAVMQVLTR